MLWRAICSAILLAATTACAVGPNIPVSNRFLRVDRSPAEAEVFLDANGTFYFDDWRSKATEQRVRNARSLFNVFPPKPEKPRDDIRAAEALVIEDLRGIIAGKDRVFVFVHGFNIDEADSGLAFSLLQRRIRFGPGDAVIKVRWDGMIGALPFGAMRAWFPATGNSQLAGMNGLRRILELPQGQKVVLISHSRGASVVLSAFATPPFDPSFRRTTLKLDPFGPGLFTRPELRDGENEMHAIFLGPAIGFPDFWKRECEPKGGRNEPLCGAPPATPSTGAEPCPQYRTFGKQLGSIRYTINPGDSILRKKVPLLSSRFNATDLGYDARVGARLAKCYPRGFLTPVPIAAEHDHAFVLYAQDPEVALMLRDVGVEAQ